MEEEIIEQDSQKQTVSIFGVEMATFQEDFCGLDIDELPEEPDHHNTRLIDISSNRFKSLDFTSQCPYAIEVNASDNQIGDGLEKLENLHFLTKLNLSSNVFENLQGFPLSEALTVLDLSKNHLTSAKDIPPLPMLKELNLSHNSIEVLDLQSFPFLQELDISGNQIKSLVLPKLPSIRILNASHNSISEISTFEEDDLPYLWSCDLCFNSIASPEILKSLAKLPLLYTLKIACNPLQAEDGSHIQPILVILPTLTTLDNVNVNAKDKVKAELKCGTAYSKQSSNPQPDA